VNTDMVPQMTWLAERRQRGTLGCSVRKFPAHPPKLIVIDCE